ncbi:MAG TPA: transglutaminase family protein [Anaeromyxobacteraceae bacterium]|nr:transglutaminase family protein [Anaeromyxobacteraceae bacterium]
MRDALMAELRSQDAILRRRGVALWIGAEPTFTDRGSQAPGWLSQPDGEDKPERAQALLRALGARLGADGPVHELPGRLFPGEELPRFCFGVRSGGALFTCVPDPAVVEVNMAPAPDLVTFLGWSEAVHAAAAEAGLAPERYRYNGQVADSGGGGQLTFGGPSPEESPFFRHPQLLPRFVRYLCNHPSLSYAFAGECVGSASQGPRPDEGARERFEELHVALDRLEARGHHLAPTELWGSLAPLLVDASGNSHRAEVNIEKLWNPYLPVRGRMGVVELRSLRMQPTAPRQAAVAGLLRAVAARVATRLYDEPLADWGGALHDQFALPHFLEEDLRGVLADLAASGLELGPATSSLLLERPKPLARAGLGEATLTVLPALEFWPLVGDVASQERSGARLVDASAARAQLAIDHPSGEAPGRLTAAGWEVPLHRASDGRRVLAGLRWRAFAPSPGLHPGLPALDPLVLHWEREGRRIAIELHGWIPGGGAYPGLPRDAEEAALRRRERVRMLVPGPQSSRTPPPPAGFTLDLRRLDALRTEPSAAAGGAS